MGSLGNNSLGSLFCIAYREKIMRDPRLPSEEETYRTFGPADFIVRAYNEVPDENGDIAMLSVEALEDATQKYYTYIFEAEKGLWTLEE